MKSLALELERLFGVAVITGIILPGFIELARRTESPTFFIAFVVMGIIAFVIDLVLVGFIKIGRKVT